MWILQLIFSILLIWIVIAMYRYNRDKVNEKKKLIEKFVQKYDNSLDKGPDGYSKEDFSVYSKIMGIYRHKLGRSPTQDELFRCYDKIKANEITYESINQAMDENGEDYKTILFPELSYTLVEVETEEEDFVSTEAEYEDETLVSEESEKPMKIGDKDDSAGINNQYILHRPTIYNISNKIVEEQDFSTDKFIKAVKEKVKSLDNDDDSELDMDEEQEKQPTVSSVESKEYKNRCGTKEEMDAENVLAIMKEARNMEELEMGCKRSSNREKLAHEYDDMVLRHDQLWKMPERRPPVCKMGSKKKCSVNPIEVQSSLLGTLLEDSKNTKVGSILPKFSYKESSK